MLFAASSARWSNIVEKSAAIFAQGTRLIIPSALTVIHSVLLKEFGHAYIVLWHWPVKVLTIASLDLGIHPRMHDMVFSVPRGFFSKLAGQFFVLF